MAVQGIPRSGPRTDARLRQKPRSPLGARLAAARLHAGLTQRQLADKLGLSQRVIAHWETQSVGLRADQLTALADALNVTTDFLLGREEEKPQQSGPSGKVRRVFEEVSTLPRHQQDEAVKFLTRFVQGCRQDSATSNS
jgi:transcriptional regulator with XRE-family HTH domain